jgi:hypothetical protein
MAPLRIGISRYASVANAIERRLALGGRLSCQIGQGRLCITLRSAGATRWDPAVQVARALDMATVARGILAAETRASVRRHARHAVVVRFEDAMVAAGCQLRASWECIVPAPIE